MAENVEEVCGRICSTAQNTRWMDEWVCWYVTKQPGNWRSLLGLNRSHRPFIYLSKEKYQLFKKKNHEQQLTCRRTEKTDLHLAWQPCTTALDLTGYHWIVCSAAWGWPSLLWPLQGLMVYWLSWRFVARAALTSHLLPQVFSARIVFMLRLLQMLNKHGPWELWIIAFCAAKNHVLTKFNE